MSNLRAYITTSADGYVAGPNQSIENPLGEGGDGIHDWAFKLRAFRRIHGDSGGDEGPSNDFTEEQLDGIGAQIMGRNMFGGGPGPWDRDEPWNGWWGENPPFHMPVYVLTHHDREPLTLSDTTFIFVTGGIRSALDQAREAAAGKDVVVGGGAEAINQYLAAGLVDELGLNVVPLVLGSGARLFEGVGPDIELEQQKVVVGDGVTHLRYAVRSGSSA
ncbi:MAG: dihydrofolate reductase family protein [Solirubrobacterales bacterium]|nr:dihydrofolate reductase family protein [Solirubrobacterales bacterium]